MSWIAGILGDFSDRDLEVIKKLHPKPLFCFSKEKIYFVAGGLKDTCVFTATKTEFHIICGLVFQKRLNSYELVNEDDWENILRNKQNHKSLDGHFVGVKWKDNQLNCFVDTLGIRNLYIFSTKHYSVVSTKLNWIAKFRKNNQLNLKAFSSNWLLSNQISTESLLKNTYRLSQGGEATIKGNRISVINKYWEPGGSDNTFENLIKEFSIVYLKNNSKLSLGFSGGLDSRVLLSILMNSPYKNWSVHTFGDTDWNDVKIASLIAKDFAIDQVYLKNENADALKQIKEIRQYVAETYLSSPSSAYLKLQYYKTLNDLGNIIIDGGSGEIARRRYMNRLLFFDKDAIVNKNIPRIIKHLRIGKTSIFNDEFVKVLGENLISEMSEFLEKMPTVSEYGIENWLDLMAIRSRFPNFAGIEQSRSDSEVVNYMPFIQPSVINSIFEIPVHVRKNGTLFKKIISLHYPKLKKYSLVKDDIIYPFYFSTFFASALSFSKRKLGRTNTENSENHYIFSLKDYLLDTIHSLDLLNFPLYDTNHIKKLVTSYFNGNFNLCKQVDWFLTFELFRQELLIKS
jgi:hypothetical protein